MVLLQNLVVSLGKNVTVAFMPWQGYNFEAILISERCVTTMFTSVHMKVWSMARDAKLSAEEITRDIPNVSEESRNLIGQALFMSEQKLSQAIFLLEK